eukprot:CAMPEP_0198612090 /NCGR_PEP_ID=MMETSP1462-20131121/157720_1 /TAXON_ID=1333877 /ORGANISM="Brandtodinium nutriculum, Strain RCC3387" /LENGTH=1019 /DNA_ID=CAMNT_0044343893 /DNA_START=1 /DNA_END=3056 /DNA_ORIENTATION=+
MAALRRPLCLRGTLALWVCCCCSTRAGADLAHKDHLDPANVVGAEAVHQDHLEPAAVADDHDSHEVHPYESLYLVFGALLIGTAVIHVTSSVHALRALPVTVVFFIIGIVLALLAEAGALQSSPTAMHSYESWAAIDPHLLLFTFLPPLLFGDAMTIDTHVARRSGLQCLILAGPGVVIGSTATAAVLYYLLPYGWDFPTSLMVGSILAATDPVAVVSLLKDLGASPVLTMQIQGESLLNDGTAMVLFTIAYGLVEGKDCGAACILTFTVKSTVGASVFGLCIGILFYLWIRAANNSLNHFASIVQISLTLACAYWSFIMAEGIFHISGVLSTVMAALVLAKKMWPVLVERKAMLEFWHVIETVGNTLVFCLAGMLTGRAIPMHDQAIQECFWAVAVYVAVTIIRFVMLLLMRPLLNRCGRSVSMRDVLIMTWGGLRGMVGLALAILVDRNRANGMLSPMDGERVLFLVGGVAALTLVVNATTAPKLCEYLGVSATPEGRMVLVAKVARSAEAHVNSELQRLLADPASSRSCMLTMITDSVRDLHEKVQSHFPVDGSGNSSANHFPTLPHAASPKRQGMHHDALPRERVLGRSATQETQLSQRTTRTAFERTISNTINHIRGTQAVVPDGNDLWQQFCQKRELVRSGTCRLASFQFGCELPEIRRVLRTSPIDPGQLQIVREVFLEIVRASYWEQLQEGRFLSGSKEPSILLNSVSLAKDRCSEGLADWQILERDLVLTDLSQVEQARTRRLQASTRADLYDMRQSAIADVRTWEVVRRCLERRSLRRHLRHQQRAIQITTAFIQAHKLAQTQIASYFGGKAHRFTDSPEEACVVVESQLEVFAAAATLNRIDKPVRKKVNTMWEVHRLCDQYRRFVLAAHDGGVLQSKEAEALMHPVAEVLTELRRDRKKISPEEACVVVESQLEVFAAAATLNRIDKPVRKKVNTMWEVHRLCDQYRRFVLAAHDGGVLQSKEAEALMHPVAEVLTELRRDRKKISDDLASECEGSGVEHMVRVAAA